MWNAGQSKNREFEFKQRICDSYVTYIKSTYEIVYYISRRHGIRRNLPLEVERLTERWRNHIITLQDSVCNPPVRVCCVTSETKMAPSQRDSESLPLTTSTAESRRHKNNVGRRILHAAGRPWRRMGRALRGGRTQNSLLPTTHSDYGSAMEHSHQREAETPEHNSLLRMASPDESRRSTSNSEQGRSEEKLAIFRLEKVLRVVLLVLICCVIGIVRPQWFPVVRHLAVWCAVAWATCIVLLAMTYVQGNRCRRITPTDQSELSALDIHEERPSDSNKSVIQLEKVLRLSLIVVLCYLVGFSRPLWLPVLSRLAAWCAVAWITCMILILMTTVQICQRPRYEREEPRELDDLISRSVTVIDDSTDPSKKETIAEEAEYVDVESPPITPMSERRGKEISGLPDLFFAGLPHPSLAPLLVVSASNNARLVPNSEPLELDNDLFHGQMLFMVRTPDVDDIQTRKGTEENDKIGKYFKSRQRRFEMQFQVKLKKVPEGKVYFACELDEPVKMGVLQKAFVGASMAFVKKMSAKDSFHYSISGQKPESDGRYEKPHMAFTVEGSMDRVVITTPGNTPPQLGSAIDEDPDSIKRRKRGGSIDWNTEDVYTFALWSAYFDFLQWKCINLPGIRPFSLTGVVGPQHINLTLYDMPKSRSSEKHYRCDLLQAVSIEIGNKNHTKPGPATRAWSAQEAQTKGLCVAPARQNSGSEAGLATIPGVDDAETAEELGEGIYLRSGEPVAIQLFPPGGDVGFGSLTDGGGFAIAQDTVSSMVTFEKVDSDRRSPNVNKANRRRPLIKSGDKVVVKLSSKLGDKGEPREPKYLSIHRGWWLKWVSIPPKKNGYFKIISLGNLQSSDSQTPEVPTDFIALGGSFSLWHARWEGYQVGVGCGESPTYGGRMLGLFTANPNGRDHSRNPDDEEPGKLALDYPGTSVVEDSSWMEPVLLRAQLPTMALTPTAASEVARQPYFDTEQQAIPENFLQSNCCLDIPAWVETMDRSERRRQVAFVVRVTAESAEGEDEGGKVGSFTRLRTGGTVAAIMRVGMSRRSTRRAYKKVRSKAHSSDS